MDVTPSWVVHILDDDPDVSGGFERVLHSAGLEVRTYESADVFFDQIDEAPPGCIVLDVTMPGINGADAMARLKEAADWLPVIVVSGRDDEAIRSLVRGLGAKMLLRKPVDDSALIDAINWVTGARAGR